MTAKIENGEVIITLVNNSHDHRVMAPSPQMHNAFRFALYQGDELIEKHPKPIPGLGCSKFAYPNAKLLESGEIIEFKIALSKLFEPLKPGAYKLYIAYIFNNLFKLDAPIEFVV
jgi:hypothetical protein